MPERWARPAAGVVTRYWIGWLLTSEMTSTHVQVLFHQALEDQGLLDAATGELLGPDGRPPGRDRGGPPILVAWSVNGSLNRMWRTTRPLLLYGGHITE